MLFYYYIILLFLSFFPQRSRDENKSLILSNETEMHGEKCVEKLVLFSFVSMLGCHINSDFMTLKCLFLMEPMTEWLTGKD